MRCPFCGEENTSVKDSRSVNNGTFIKRRRNCIKCGAKFTTFEIIQLKATKIVKKDGSFQDFDRTKILRSIEIALRKRPVSRENIDVMLNNIMYKLERAHDTKITTKLIGKLIMEQLSKVDKVAFIRFASVYMNFENENDFLRLIQDINVD